MDVRVWPVYGVGMVSRVWWLVRDGVGLGRGVCGAGEVVWVEEWEGVFDVDRVGWDDCALVVGGGVESVVYGMGGVGEWC